MENKTILIISLIVIGSLLSISFLNKDNSCVDSRVCSYKYIGYDRLNDGQWHNLYLDTEKNKVVIGEVMPVQKETLDKLFQKNK
jgi:hypothetical protein